MGTVSQNLIYNLCSEIGAGLKRKNLVIFVFLFYFTLCFTCIYECTTCVCLFSCRYKGRLWYALVLELQVVVKHHGSHGSQIRVLWKAVSTLNTESTQQFQSWNFLTGWKWRLLCLFICFVKDYWYSNGNLNWSICCDLFPEDLQAFH